VESFGYCRENCGLPAAAARFRSVDDLMPVSGKVSFPNAVPFCFALPPRVADAASLMSLVPDFDFSALGDHREVASRAPARKTRFSFVALPVDGRELHKGRT
jgi:hypothetical protein